MKYGDEVDKKHHFKRRKRSNSDDDGSSDGERTLELASSHSSDEDEATSVHGPVRSATLGKGIIKYAMLSLLYLMGYRLSYLLPNYSSCKCHYVYQRRGIIITCW